MFLRKLKVFFKNLIIEHIADIKPQEIKYEIKNIGSKYGGWVIALTPTLKNSFIISCGAGEDISFDIEVASLFNAKLIIVDPTPRSKVHLEGVLKRFENYQNLEPTESGSVYLNPFSYDLTKISKEQIIYINKAIWEKEEKVKFFVPPNPEHISFSIVDYQNNFSQEGEFIYVDTTRYENLLKLIKDKKTPEILKLDIEGAEYNVIDDVINYPLPNQILLEYDELSDFSLSIIKRVKKTHQKLLKEGYILFSKEKSNFSYLRNNLEKKIINQCPEANL